MLIRTDEKSVTLTPFGSLALGAANGSRGGGQSWIEIIRTALSQLSKANPKTGPLRASLRAWLPPLCGP
jgi:hypothetical protein